jgi:glucose-6-phosphate 1-dehydrogenase
MLAGSCAATQGCVGSARMMMEIPFGYDPLLARNLNAILRRVFLDSATVRIDHRLGKRPVDNVVIFRFADLFMEPFRISITRIAITS